MLRRFSRHEEAKVIYIGEGLLATPGISWGPRANETARSAADADRLLAAAGISWGPRANETAWSGAAQ